jgi:hypothetical protein
MKKIAADRNYKELKKTAQENSQEKALGPRYVQIDGPNGYNAMVKMFGGQMNNLASLMNILDQRVKALENK